MRADDKDESAPPPPLPVGADKAFLGAEFATWLYFHLAHEGFALTLDDAFPDKNMRPEDGLVQFQIGKRAVLRTLDATGARVALSGPDLDDSGELLQAIRRGAYIESLELTCAVSERVYTFTLKAADGSISGVKLPDLFTPVDDGPSDEEEEEGKRARPPRPRFEDVLALRMECLDEIERIVDALFRRFVTRRIARAWLAEDVKALRKKVAAGLAARLG
jgi:hypothetical protein